MTALLVQWLGYGLWGPVLESREGRDSTPPLHPASKCPDWLWRQPSLRPGHEFDHRVQKLRISNAIWFHGMDRRTLPSFIPTHNYIHTSSWSRHKNFETNSFGLVLHAIYGQTNDQQQCDDKIQHRKCYNTVTWAVMCVGLICKYVQFPSQTCWTTV